MPKVKDSRLVVITAGGSPNSLAYATWQRAVASPDWRTSYLSGPCPWWNARAVEAVRAELTPAQYAQLIELSMGWSPMRSSRRRRMCSVVWAIRR
jgi:hypothetical protein